MATTRTTNSRPLEAQAAGRRGDGGRFTVETRAGSGRYLVEWHSRGTVHRHGRVVAGGRPTTGHPGQRARVVQRLRPAHRPRAIRAGPRRCWPPPRRRPRTGSRLAAEEPRPPTGSRRRLRRGRHGPPTRSPPDGAMPLADDRGLGGCRSPRSAAGPDGIVPVSLQRTAIGRDRRPGAVGDHPRPDERHLVPAYRTFIDGVMGAERVDGVGHAARSPLRGGTRTSC